jgi:hypothetical protein
MTSSRHAVLRAALIGLGLGVAWGAAARVWMRLVSTAPEFSWAGTSIILGFSGLLGLLLGLSWCARHARGRRRWLRLLFVPGLVLFAGQGLPLAPGLLVAGPLLRRTGVPARVGTVLAVCGPAVLVWWSERLNEDTMLSAPTRVQFWLLVGMPVLSTALAFAGHLVMGPLGVRSVDGVGRARPQQAAQRLQA